MRVLVTGAAGMLGRSLVRQLLDDGSEVMALVRDPSCIQYSHPRLSWAVGDIRDAALLARLMEGVGFVAHLAARKNDERDSRAVNVDGTKVLLAAAEAAGVQGFLYASTISAAFAKRGLYAETKHEAEELVRAAPLPTVIVRPSVIYEDFGSGILGSITRYARLPFMPIIGKGTVTYRPIHVDDAARAFALIIKKAPRASAEYDLGGPDEVSFNELARIVAREVGKPSIPFLHVPSALVLPAARVLAHVLPRPPITVSNVLGAVQDAPVDTRPFEREYGFHALPLSEGILKAKERTELLSTEPYVLLRYVMQGVEPSDALAARYEAALARFSLPRDTFDPEVLRDEGKLRALDAVTRFSKSDGVARRKFLVAAALAECSPASASELLPQARSLVSLFFLFARAGLASAFALARGAFLSLRPSFLSRNA